MTRNLPYRYRVLLLLFFLTVLTYLDRICISIVGVRMKSALGLSNEQFGWVLGAFALAYALFEIPSGVLGDRVGPRAVLIRIVLCWSVFTALTGMVTGIFSLLLIRFLFGAGEAGTYPNIMIVVSRWLPAAETGRALSLLGIGSQVGSAVAPLIIVPLAVSYGWRVPFFVIGAIGLFWVLICYSWFRNFPSGMRLMPEAEKKYVESKRRIMGHGPLVPWRQVLRSRNLLALMGMYFCNQAANYFFIAWMPVYLQEGRHFTESQMRNIVFVLFVVGIAGFLAGGYLSDLLVKSKGLRTGRRVIGMTGLCGCGLFILLSGISAQREIASLCLIAANGFFSFGVMVSYGTCIDIGGNNAGSVTGAMNFSGQMGAFVLAIVFGKMTDATQGYSIPLFLLASLACAGSFLWLIIDPEKLIGGPVPDNDRLGVSA